MRFAFSDEQKAFARSMRELLSRSCTPADVRTAWASESGRDAAHWRALADVGALALALPEAAGGLGGTALDWILPLEEAGRAALPEPLLETIVAAPLLAALAPEHPLLARIASGDAIVVAALDDAGERDGTAERDGMAKRDAVTQLHAGALVADAHVAEALLLLHDHELHLVPRPRTRLTLRTSVDGARRLFAVEWTPSAETRLVPRGTSADTNVVVPGGTSAALVSQARDRGSLAAAAMLLGLGARMLELTVDYVKVRKQFGAAVGSFQAVKHQLADALVALELARPLVYHAAYTMAGASPAATFDVAMAKAAASEAALVAGRAALQCHGAIGYSFEYDLHLWMKRAWALAAAHGDARSQRARLAAHLLDGGSAHE